MSGDPFAQVITAQGLTVSPAIQRLHLGRGVRRYIGQCDITRGTGMLARFCLWLAGFPPAGQQVPTRLTIIPTTTGADWRRDFDGHVTRSRLSCNSAKDRVIERFGPIRLTLSLRADAGRLRISVERLRVLGLPMPRALIPLSNTTESQDPDGTFCFDVAARLPWGGLLIRYAGTLRPA